jgi:hypothetical protein
VGGSPARRRLTHCARPGFAERIPVGHERDGAAPRLLARTLPKWAELRRDLQGFIGKHDHRKRQPFTEAESAASLRALEVVAGAPGLFGNDLRIGMRRLRRGGA